MALGILLVTGADHWLDTLTQYDWTLTAGYMIPIGFASWVLGVRAGLLATMAAIFFQAMSPGSREVIQRHSFWLLLAALGGQMCVLATGAYIMATIRKHFDKERELSRTDHLTGCWNAREFWNAMEVEQERMTRTGHPLSVIFMDVDNFKAVNDTYGHGKGDEVLKTIGRVLMDELRITDVPARMGGDEFAIALPCTDSATAARVGERIRVETQERVGELGVRATLSVGVVTYDSEPHSMHELVSNADRLMYSVKQNGKNAVAAQAFG